MPFLACAVNPVSSRDKRALPIQPNPAEMDATKMKLEGDLPEIKTVEMHSGGEPLRIIESGYPAIEGKTVLEKRRYCRNKLDHLRKMLMFEPRGHDGMYGAVLVEPDIQEAHFGVIFMHNEGETN